MRTNSPRVSSSNPRISQARLLPLVETVLVVALVTLAGCATKNAAPPAATLAIQSSHTGNFVQGQAGATYTLTVSNMAGAGPTSGTVTATDTLPTGLTASAIAGSGWTCTLATVSCTRSDVLAAGGSYPVITVTVNVATNANTPLTNQASVTGGGSATATGSDSTVVNTPPTLSIVKTHTGNFVQGQTGATYTVTVSNGNNAAPTSGTVTVTESVPSGLTLTGMAGTGWTCTTLPTCTRNDALAGGSSYPVITVTVNVASNATTPLTNQVSVSGGGSASNSNQNPTTINTLPTLSISKTHSGNFLQGEQGATYTVTVSNAANAAATNGTVTVTEAVPTGLTLTAMAGTGWTCTTLPTCTRNDALAGGSSYPAITVTVNVDPAAPASVTNQVSVSGGGSAGNSTQDVTTIIVTPNCLPSAITPTGGNESLLNGHYAIVLQGFQGAGVGTPVAMAASFTADGTGKLTAGEFDLNEASGPVHSNILPSGSGSVSTYTVGPDPKGAGQIGCMVIESSTQSAIAFRFALGGVSGGIASRGRIIEYDDTTGTGTRITGLLRQQTASAFSTGNTSALQSRYAFGMDGVDPNGGHFAKGGSFNLNTANGSITNLVYDQDDAGTIAGPITAGTPTGLGTVSATTGRSPLTITTSSGTVDVAAYIVNPAELFLIQTDESTSGNGVPITSGMALATPASYTSSLLSGNYIIHVTGISGCSSGGGTVPCAQGTVGLLTLTPGTASDGTISGTLSDYNVSSGVQNNTISGGTYSVDATTGRTVLTNVGNNPPVLYLTTPTDGISAFIVGSDNSAIFGEAEFQPAATYTTAGLAGSYYWGTADPGENAVQDVLAVVTLDNTGNITGGTQYRSDQNSGGPYVDDATGQLQFSITGAFGPGTGDLGAGSGAIIITNGSRIFLFLEDGSDPPLLMILDQQ